MKALYKYLQRAFPHEDLIDENRRRGRGQPEYELLDTGVHPASRDPYEITSRFGDEFATNAAYIERYRNSVAFHPVHALLATHPLRRLKHASRVVVAGAEMLRCAACRLRVRGVCRGAIRDAERAHGGDCSVVCVN